MYQRFWNLRWIGCLLAAGSLAGLSPGTEPVRTGHGTPLLPAAPILRLSQNIPGDSKPIIVHADEIATWMQGEERVFLCQGLVIVEHGVVQARMMRAVAWVNPAHTHQSGILHLVVYAEDKISLEKGPVNQIGQIALLDLQTRGELKIRSQRGKVQQQSLARDPLYLRAQAQRSIQQAAPGDGVEQSSLHVPDGKGLPTYLDSIPAYGYGSPVPPAAAPESGIRSPFSPGPASGTVQNRSTGSPSSASK